MNGEQRASESIRQLERDLHAQREDYTSGVDYGVALLDPQSIDLILDLLRNPFIRAWAEAIVEEDSTIEGSEKGGAHHREE